MTYPELKSWLCAGCRKWQPASDKRYGSVYCRLCAHKLCMASYNTY